ncbi:MAG TPA: hypothetical protein PLF63_06065 [Rubrivivax sp.]|nr:hypothetical protein [Rubrivivax sp.]
MAQATKSFNTRSSRRRSDMPQAVADNNRPSFQSGTAYLAADTPLGVAYLGVGHASQGSTAVYLYLGKPF